MARKHPDELFDFADACIRMQRLAEELGKEDAHRCYGDTWQRRWAAAEPILRERGDRNTITLRGVRMGWDGGLKVTKVTGQGDKEVWARLPGPIIDLTASGWKRVRAGKESE